MNTETQWEWCRTYVVSENRPTPIKSSIYRWNFPLNNPSSVLGGSPSCGTGSGSPWTSEAPPSCWTWSTPRRDLQGGLTMNLGDFHDHEPQKSQQKKTNALKYWSKNEEFFNVLKYILIDVLKDVLKIMKSLLGSIFRGSLLAEARRGPDVRGVLWSRPFCEMRGAQTVAIPYRNCRRCHSNAIQLPYLPFIDIASHDSHDSHDSHGNSRHFDAFYLVFAWSFKIDMAGLQKQPLM